MNWWQALILGVVEGVTEYLPISSTGHLLLTQRLLHISDDDASKAFIICIQGGAIVAVLGIFRHRMWQALRGTADLLRGKADSNPGSRLVINLIVAFLPAAILGSLFDEQIEDYLMGMWPIAIAWFIGGIAILAIDYWMLGDPSSEAGKGKPVDQMSWVTALGIGILQTIAMCPGTSRSLITILGGLLLGLSLAAAVEFSFLLGVITLLAATVFKLVKSGDALFQQYDAGAMLIGAVAAWISAVIAVRWMLSFLKSHRLSVFGYYRLALAAVVACGLYLGWISA